MAERASKSIHNWRRYPSSKCYENNENLRFGICCRAVAPTPQRKMAIWVHNYLLQVHKSLKDILENLLSVWLLGRTNLFVPSRFWTTCMNFDNGCQCYIATCRKTIQVHIYVLGPKIRVLRWNFLQISQLSTWSGAHKTFPPIFGPFAIFDRNYAKIVATPSDENKKCPAILKGQFRVATSLGEKNSRTFQGHSSTFSRPISATFYCDAGILKVIA